MQIKTVLVLIVSWGSFGCLYVFYNTDVVTQICAAAGETIQSRWTPTFAINATEVFTRLDLSVQTPICHQLFHGDPEAIKKAHWKWHDPLPDDTFLQLTANCEDYRGRRGFHTSNISATEQAFPIAFSILIYHHAEQVERLLRAIYRPHNEYCIHVDRKAPITLHNAVAAIAACFDNVFLVPSPTIVYWGTMSILEAESSCMHLLWARRRQWKYFINLTGEEFPLKTNAELVAILSVFNGASDVPFNYGRMNRFENRYRYKCKNGQHDERVPKPPPPHGMQLAVGSTHVALSRAFVDYAIHNRNATDFFRWLRDTCIPDETFFSSLIVNPALKVPGAYTGDLEQTDVVNTHFTRFKKWIKKGQTCKGREAHLVCIQNIHYLPELKYAREMFVNKFHIDYDPLALRCLEELIYERTLQDIHTGAPRSSLHLDYYKQADFIQRALDINSL